MRDLRLAPVPTSAVRPSEPLVAARPPRRKLAPLSVASVAVRFFVESFLVANEALPAVLCVRSPANAPALAGTLADADAPMPKPALPPPPKLAPAPALAPNSTPAPAPNDAPPLMPAEKPAPALANATGPPSLTPPPTASPPSAPKRRLAAPFAEAIARPAR